MGAFIKVGKTVQRVDFASEPAGLTDLPYLIGDKPYAWAAGALWRDIGFIDYSVEKGTDILDPSLWP